MNQSKLSTFQIAVIAFFGFFIVAGVIVFATYKSDSTEVSTANVTVWGLVNEEAFTGFIAKLNSEYFKELKVTYTQIPEESFDNTVVEALADGTGPDALLIPHDKMQRYINKIYPIPFETYPERTFKDNFVQGSEIFLRGQSVLGLPFFIDPLVMYWNRDIFTNNQIAQAPTNWADLPILASKISKSDSNANILKSAVAFGEYRNVNNAKEIISALIMQAGSNITKFNAEGNVVSAIFDSGAQEEVSPAESAVRFYADYSNPKKTVYSWNRALPTSKSYFLRGDLAVYFGLGSEYTDIKIKNPNLNFDMALFPQIVDSKVKSTFGKEYGFVLMKSSQNLGAAFSVFSYLTSREAQDKWLSLTDFAPTRRDIIAQGTSNAIDSVLYNSALISKAWVDPDKEKTALIFQNMIEDVTTGRLNVSASVRKMSDQINNL